MTELLTPQEVVQAMLGGKAVEYRKKGCSIWVILEQTRPSVHILINDSFEFRLVQGIVTIGDVSFPEAYVGNMKKGRIYYSPVLGFKSLYGVKEWEGDMQDIYLMKKRLVHLTKDNAIAHAKALIKLSGGDL